MLKQLSPEQQYKLDCEIRDRLLSKPLIKKIYKYKTIPKNKKILCSRKHL